MKQISLGLKLAIVTTVLGVASQAMAANITIADNNSGAGGFGGGPYGPAGEDNETEPGTVHSQIWDLEAFNLVGTRLDLIGGYNLNTGDAATGFKPGDLFIKVGGAAPSGNPSTYVSGNQLIPNSYVYNYAIVLSGGLGSSAAVQSLNSSSTLKAVEYDQFLSNPWKYESGGTPAGPTAISYTAGLTDAQVSTTYGLTLQGGTHNVVSIDLGFLAGSVPAGTPVYFSYTMQCGNDSIKGQFGGGFRTPDGGATLMLLGLGLGSLGLVSRKLRPD